MRHTLAADREPKNVGGTPAAPIADTPFVVDAESYGAKSKYFGEKSAWTVAGDGESSIKEMAMHKAITANATSHKYGTEYVQTEPPSCGAVLACVCVWARVRVRAVRTHQTWRKEDERADVGEHKRSKVHPTFQCAASCHLLTPTRIVQMLLTDHIARAVGAVVGTPHPSHLVQKRSLKPSHLWAVCRYVKHANRTTHFTTRRFLRLAAPT